MDTKKAETIRYAAEDLAHAVRIFELITEDIKTAAENLARLQGKKGHIQADMYSAYKRLAAAHNPGHTVI